MIYFVRIPDGRIKIGVTYSFTGRLPSLSGQYGRPITLLAITQGWELEERLLHNRFSEIRYHNTELFEPTAELMDFIANLPEPVIRSVEELEERGIRVDHPFLNEFTKHARETFHLPRALPAGIGRETVVMRAATLSSH